MSSNEKHLLVIFIFFAIKFKNENTVTFLIKPVGSNGCYF